MRPPPAGPPAPAGNGAPALWEALLPVATMVVLFAAGVAAFGFTPELLVVVLLLAATAAGAVAARHGAGWTAVQRATGEKIAGVLPALLILLAIGALVGTWVLSGTIPFLVYWGVRLVDPGHLLLTAFLAAGAMSLTTGTSWGSAGTVGVALMGTAAALGAPLPATAGAVVSGAYLGDKMSPLSDSTNIAAIGAGAPLFDHVRHMLWTAGPSFAVAVVVYAVAGARAASGGGDLPPGAVALLEEIEAVFSLGWWTLLPAVLVAWGIVRGAPAALVIAGSAAAAALLGATLQPFGLEDAVRAFVTGFDADMTRAAGVEPGGLSPLFLTLVQRGGVNAMATTLVVVIAAFLLAGAMDASGSLDLLVRRTLDAVDSVFGLVAATLASAATLVGLTSHQGVTALVVGELYQGAYAERGLAPENLSRSIEDGATLTEPLMPWTVSAVFMATTLGVPTVAYAPWAVFLWCGPLFSLLVAALSGRRGPGVRRLPDPVASRPTSVPG